MCTGIVTRRHRYRRHRRGRRGRRYEFGAAAVVGHFTMIDTCDPRVGAEPPWEPRSSQHPVRRPETALYRTQGTIPHFLFRDGLRRGIRAISRGAAISIRISSVALSSPHRLPLSHQSLHMHGPYGCTHTHAAVKACSASFRPRFDSARMNSTKSSSVEVADLAGGALSALLKKSRASVYSPIW